MIEPHVYAAVTSRREFLALILSAIVLHAAGCSNTDNPVVPPGVDDLPLDLRQVLDAYFESDDLLRVRFLGRVYRENFEGDGKEFRADLARVVETIAPIKDIPTAVETLHSLVIEDFAKLNVISLANWQLARTEVRLAALVDNPVIPPGVDDLPDTPPDLRLPVRKGAF